MDPMEGAFLSEVRVYQFGAESGSS